MALLACFFISCSNDNEAADAVPADGTQVSFVLSLSNATNGTRATWSDKTDREEGDDYENRINPDDLHVLLYSTDNTCVATVKILSYTPTGDNSDYLFIGTVEPVNGQTLTQGDYKMMVFANCELVTPDTDLDNLVYEYSKSDVASGKQLIPMWGVATKKLTLEKGKRDDMGTIDLLRAFAKVEINLDDEISNTYTINSAVLTRYNQQGYCLPAGYADVDLTIELDQEDGTNPSFHPNSTEQSANLDFSYSKDRKSAYLYIPEYDNSTNEAEISITLSDGTTGTLYFKHYTDGSPTDDSYDIIVRNHIYRYTINVYQGELTVQAAVMPWQVVTSSIGWKPQHAPTDHNPFDSSTEYNQLIEDGFYILLPRQEFKDGRVTVQQVFHDLYESVSKGDDEPNYCVIYRPRYNSDSHNDLNVNSGGATFFFMLTGPKGATWEAHLTNTDDFKFLTSSSDYFAGCTDVSETTGLTYAQEGKVNRSTHGIARKKPYVIEINAVHSYTGTGKDGTVSSYPNGLEDDDDWAEYFGDDYLTEWGRDKWYGHKVVDTEFYITVKLADGTEYELDINPSYSGKNAPNTNFKNNHRYAGTDKRIWFRQLRAIQGWGYNYLAEDISPTETNNSDVRDNFQWWRVNPYWK